MKRLLLALVLLLPAMATASTPPPDLDGLPVPDQVRVGVREAPPFTTFNEATGRWEGLSVQLWLAVIRDLGIETEFVELDLVETMPALARPEPDGVPVVDIVISPLTITAERERVVDFTHQYFPSGLAIVTWRSSGIDFGRAVSRLGETLLTGTAATALLALVLVTFAFAALAFAGSRHYREDDVRAGPAPHRFGFFAVLGALKATGVDTNVFEFRSWFMITVSLVMLAIGTVLSSILAGVITASLTLSALDQEAIDVERIGAGQRVGVLTGSTHEAYWRMERADIEPVLIDEGQRAGLRRLLDGEIDLFLGDEAQLAYLVTQRPFRGQLELHRQNATFEPYGWAIPLGSPYRKVLNLRLMSVLRSPDWPRLVDAAYGR